MNRAIEITSVAFACCFIFSLFYWQIVHRVSMRALRFKLFALRDSARRYAADKGIGNTFEFRYIDQFMCKTLLCAPHISFASFIWHYLKHDAQPSATEVRFRNEASREFLEIRDATSKTAITMMMLNSPLIVTIGSMAIPILWAVGRLSKVRIYRGAEKFVENIEVDSSAALPATA